MNINRIVTFLNKNDILNPSRTGFVKGSKTAGHVFVLKTIIDNDRTMVVDPNLLGFHFR